jgi:hypothetical protein
VARQQFRVPRSRLGQALAEGNLDWLTAAFAVSAQPLNHVLRRLSQTGLRRTLAGDHWAWGALGLAAYALRRARQPIPDVHVVRMSPGERFVVGLVPRDSSSDST